MRDVSSGFAVFPPAPKVRSRRGLWNQLAQGIRQRMGPSCGRARGGEEMRVARALLLPLGKGAGADGESVGGHRGEALVGRPQSRGHYH